MAIQSALNRNAHAHLRRHFLRLIKQPGLHNRGMVEALVSLIDEAFRHYRLWPENGDETEYQHLR
ncbi:MAG: hypothetical protein F6J98_33675 [Moorea sp. SIO4G2]|nr:hypothetical protein [Moorena sp. SIO4G2]